MQAPFDVPVARPGKRPQVVDLSVTPCCASVPRCCEERRLRIAVFHDLPSGGAKRSLYEVVRRLARRHVVDVYSLSRAEHAYCDVRTFVRRHHTYRLAEPRLFGSPYGRLNALQRWRGLYAVDALAGRIAADMDSGGYDVVYAQPSMQTQAPAVLRHLRTPAVYHVQEALRSVYEPVIVRPYANRGWRRAADSVDPMIRLYQRALKRFDRANTLAPKRLLANSRFTAERVRRIYARAAEVRYFGVDVELFQPAQPAITSHGVLSVGALVPTKGFDFLVSTLGRIPSSTRPQLRIVANASNPHEVGYLTQLAATTGVQVVIEQAIDDAHLVQRYLQAEIVLYAPIAEPFGLVPLEAMACAKPVIGVAEGGVTETIEHGVTGELVARDADRFAAALVALLAEPQRAAAYGEAGRACCLDRWTWDQSTAGIEAELVAVASGASAP